MWGTKKPDKRLAEFEEQQRLIIDLLRLILGVVKQNRSAAQSATLTIKLGGKIMPLSVNLNDNPGTALFQEFSGLAGAGSVVAPVGAVSYASDNHSVATVDPASGLLAYVGVGVANISGADAGNSLSASEALTIGPAVAKSATLVITPGK